MPALLENCNPSMELRHVLVSKLHLLVLMHPYVQLNVQLLIPEEIPQNLSTHDAGYQKVLEFRFLHEYEDNL